ncbi:MAG: tetratricopeptide repeat protein [Planctomycetaceae bacterium]|nr:tetratricopeptide repeat protein [Planctomycetaceae bacterium]
MKPLQCILIVAATFTLTLPSELIAAEPDDHPLSREQRDRLQSALLERVEQLSKTIDEAATVSAYSQRGDAYFFLGDFDRALADYEKMVELNSDSGSSHWRRGIARFYAKKYPEAAKQFEEYHSFDNVDRENGIWRYLSQHRAYGVEKAREGLLKYEKDDREPFPAVYKLFSGELKSEDVMLGLQLAKRTTEQQASCEFYAHLYVGLNAALEGDDELALKHLTEATNNSWPREAGYGPRYMWHVGRLHADLLRKTAEAKSE